VLPDLATGYQWIDNHLALKVTLRHGVTFTDGTAFNATAVEYNIDRDLTPSYACHCAANFSAVSSVSTSGNYTVILHLSRLFSPLPSAFINAIPGYIYSPTALQSEGEQQFSEKPVGAGPFEVQSDVANSTLTLVKNPGYWEKGHRTFPGWCSNPRARTPPRCCQCNPVRVRRLRSSADHEHHPGEIDPRLAGHRAAVTDVGVRSAEPECCSVQQHSR